MAQRSHDHTRGVPSTAAIAGHPMHPMLIPFPLAFLVGALVTDLLQLSTGDPFWARASFWLLAAVALLLMITGWFGGELSYRHLIGVTGDGDDSRA